MAVLGAVKCGAIKSCGCLQREIMSKTSYKHGCCTSSTYRSWNSMIWRCGKSKNYENISYCKEWESFENFYKDMGERPEGTTLDRIDSSKGYNSHNCRWITRSQQCMNTRKQKTISSSKYKGVDFNKNRKFYRARIAVNYKRIYLGVFSTQEEAALAYNEAAKKYFGEFAVLNVIENN